MFLRGKQISRLQILRRTMVISSQSGSAQPGTVDYTGICQIIEGKACADLKGTAVLIDVRPPTEIAKSGGSIPTAKNIPRTSIKQYRSYPISG